MRRLGFLAATATLAFAALLAPSAQAAEGTCSSRLDELTVAQTTLDQLRAAHEEGEATRKALRKAIFDLEVEIETMKLDGTSEARIANRQAALREASDELATSVKVAPALDMQIEVLSTEVDAASREYLTCVDASLE